MRVIVTGSRDWADPPAVWTVLDELLAAHGELTVVHGGARGTDQDADDWATRQIAAGRPVRVERFPASWATHGRSAGILRNIAMVARGGDRCDAFIRTDRPCRGTADCAGRAEAAGIPVFRHYPEANRAQ